MSKKRKNRAKNSAPKRDLNPYFGLFICVSALLFFLSAFSFAFARPSSNWLGLLGASVGWVGHALFGIGSYFFALFVGWFGWRLLFHKPISHPMLKGLFMALFLLSLGLLANLIEFSFPTFGG